jgi:hypothetical protein
MAPYLPQEILSLIVQNVVKEDEGHKLTPYTLVNKSWQAAFERQLYASIVVMSPSDVTTVMVSPNERRKKRGLSLATLNEITNGPQHWRQLRRTYIHRVLYRVAVPYWINPFREVSSSTFSCDNAWRRGNDQAFSKGIWSLFDYLSTWMGQHISLDIALQAEMGDYVRDCNAEDDEEDTYDDVKSSLNEPGTSYMQTEFDTVVPPYGAHLSPDLHLPRAGCVTLLDFPIIDFVDSDTYCSENSISLPAILRIASACGALRRIRLDGKLQRFDNNYGVPYMTPEIWIQERDATAFALTQIPPTIQHIEFLGDLIYADYLEIRDTNPRFHRQDPLSTALRDISMQLKTLHIKSEAIFPELFSLQATEGLADINWPRLEVLHLAEIYCDSRLFGVLERYADGYSTDEALSDRYIEDMYTSLGYAAEKMPKLKHVFVEIEESTLSLDFHDGRWILSIMVHEHTTYKPSLNVFEAWKVDSENLQFRTGINAHGCDNARFWEATFTSWPPPLTF